MADHKTDPSKLPAIGRALLWVDKPGSANKIFWALAAICVGLVLYGFTYEAHGHFDMENISGFYGLFGFVAFSIVIFGAKALRVLIKRPEDYYGDHAVDAEDYPRAGLEKRDHDA